MDVGGYRTVIQDIHSLEPLDLTENLLLVRDGRSPMYVLGIKGGDLSRVATRDDLKPVIRKVYKNLALSVVVKISKF